MRQTFLQDAICIHLCPTPLPLSSFCIFCFINFEFLAFCFAFYVSNLAIPMYASSFTTPSLFLMVHFAFFLNSSPSIWFSNYECRLILLENESVRACADLCVSLCLCLSICVFMCVCVRGLGGSGQVIHPSTSPCAWWRIWGMLNVALQPLSPHFCMLLHSITFQSSCVQPFLA